MLKIERANNGYVATVTKDENATDGMYVIASHLELLVFMAWYATPVGEYNKEFADRHTVVIDGVKQEQNNGQPNQN